jgi:tetratricopeptide (TPR) repeat protein
MDAKEYFNLGLSSTMTRKKIGYFTKALELNPTIADAYAKRGMLFYFQEKYDKMIQDFKSYMECVPATAEAHHMLGVGYLKTGRFKEAASSLTRAIEMAPDLAGAYANRAEVYLSMGKYEHAINDSTKAIEIWGDPQTMSDAYRTRAKVNWEIGSGEGFYEDNRTALYLDPKSWRVTPGSSWGGNTPLKTMRQMGLIYLIGIAFVLIFRLTLKAPDKED